MIPALAFAGQYPEQLCSGQTATPGPDGRVLGHIPYAEAPAGDLVAAPAGFAIGQPCLVNRAMAPDLGRLLAAAAATPGVGRQLRGVSCFRSIERQRTIFCSQIGPGRRCRDAAERARTVGPPAYSEHATGYALDFGIRPNPGCPDVNPCIARSTAGAWLLAHATDYGFELSFPQGNAQGVTWEPWHWRWVGVAATDPGAAAARLLFARARSRFPARPAVSDTGEGRPMPGTSPYPTLPYPAPPYQPAPNPPLPGPSATSPPPAPPAPDPELPPIY